MVIIVFVIAYFEFLIIREVLRKKWNIKLDLIPDRYGNDLKRTWLNAGILIGCFLVTLIIMSLMFGIEFFAIVPN